ncbi:hypothetical protein [Novosphingobium sp. MBES04]|uniref:hypothetical protein n=1 Tax=Novosphingobium sp. MBES04 TaxID=1206458 RepID=UPI001F562B95|nr:hypothetical protein [Novosphingobium sp. MBES04]
MSVLRIALLSMTDPTGAGQTPPRAGLRVAGASLARHQLGLVLALKCHRIVCLAAGGSSDVQDLERAAQDAGVQFRIVSGPHDVPAQVGEADELFVITDGLFVDPDVALPLLEDIRSCVLVQPVEGARTAGYERIDLNRCAAGLMRLPGGVVDRLREVPEESDTISILTRLALQAGTPMRDVPAAVCGGANWRLVTSEADAIGLEEEWLHRHFTAGRGQSPGRLLAQYGAVAFGATLLQVGRASNVVSAAALVLLALAGLLGWFGLPGAGFFVAGLTWILIEGGRKVRAAERRPLGEAVPAIERADAMVWLVDVVLAGLVLLAAERLPGQDILHWLYVPASLFLVIALAPRILEGWAGALISDRAVLALLLALGATFGQVLGVVQVLALSILVAELVLAKRAGV